MNTWTVSDPEEAKKNVRDCLKMIIDAKKEYGDNEFLNMLETKMNKLAESVEKLKGDK